MLGGWIAQGPASLLYQNEQKKNENKIYCTYLLGPCPAALVLDDIGGHKVKMGPRWPHLRCRSLYRNKSQLPQKEKKNTYFERRLSAAVRSFERTGVAGGAGMWPLSYKVSHNEQKKLTSGGRHGSCWLKM